MTKKKWVCPVKDNPCPYDYGACYNPKLFCRILEDTPEHFEQKLKKKNAGEDEVVQFT